MFKPRFRRMQRPYGPGSAGQSSHFAGQSRQADTETRQGRCVALVDARFMGWLTEPVGPGGQANAAEPSQTVLQQLRASLGGAGLDVDLVRLYWYSDKELTALTNDVVFRGVPDPAFDGGQSTARAMAADLARLSENRGTDHVLLVSDDERLWSAMDTAQLRGLCVHTLCDASAMDFLRLQQDDPSWARLLAQADRRVFWSADTDKRPVGTPVSAAGEESEAEDNREQIMAHIARWWDDEPETQRLDLHDELQMARSIPQEVDRHLLLLLSRELGHPLSWPEKKIMREGVRQTVLGTDTPGRSFPAGDPPVAGE